MTNNQICMIELARILEITDMERQQLQWKLDDLKKGIEEKDLLLRQKDDEIKDLTEALKKANYEAGLNRGDE